MYTAFWLTNGTDHNFLLGWHIIATHQPVIVEVFSYLLLVLHVYVRNVNFRPNLYDIEEACTTHSLYFNHLSAGKYKCKCLKHSVKLLSGLDPNAQHTGKLETQQGIFTYRKPGLQGAAKHSMSTDRQGRVETHIFIPRETSQEKQIIGRKQQESDEIHTYTRWAR